MNRKDDYIAVFDSGVGGVSVLRELLRLMPQERFLYYGDSANAPYGSRTTQQVRELTLEAAHYLVEQGIKALVVACNTATSAAIRQLRQMYPDLIVIGIEPALKLAADRFPGGSIAVMATEVTLREEKFDQLHHRFGAQCRIISVPAPGLVELIEAGHRNDEAVAALLQPLLVPLRGKVDAVVLGCTHYPFAAQAIGQILGPGTVLLDGGEGTARETRRRLENAGLLRRGQGEVEFRTSARDARILQLAKELTYS